MDSHDKDPQSFSEQPATKKHVGQYVKANTSLFREALHRTSRDFFLKSKIAKQNEPYLTKALLSDSLGFKERTVTQFVNNPIFVDK